MTAEKLEDTLNTLENELVDANRRDQTDAMVRLNKLIVTVQSDVRKPRSSRSAWHETEEDETLLFDNVPV